MPRRAGGLSGDGLEGGRAPFGTKLRINAQVFPRAALRWRWARRGLGLRELRRAGGEVLGDRGERGDAAARAVAAQLAERLAGEEGRQRALELSTGVLKAAGANARVARLPGRDELHEEG